MDTAGLAQKQTRLLAAFRALQRLNEAIEPRQTQLKKRMEKLAQIHKFTPFGIQRRKIEAFMKRAGASQKRAGTMIKAHAVIDNKVQAILGRNKADVAAFDRLLDRAIEATDRQGEAQAAYLSELDQLIAEADVILAK